MVSQPTRMSPVSLRTLHVAVLAALLALTGCTQTRQQPDAPPADVFPFQPEAAPTFTSQGQRIATLNTEFMFDGLDDEGQATFPHKGDPEAARAHRAEIGRIVRMLDADVVVLEEVENERAMQMLVEEQLQDMSYRVYFVEGRDSFTGQDVGMLARVPVDTVGRTDVRVPVGSTDREYGVSKNLFARMHLSGQPVTVVGLHFLARPLDADREPRREAQAEVIRRLVAQELAAGRGVVVLGDFNDYDESVLDLAGSVPISDVLATIKAAGEGPSDDLHNVMAEVPQQERYSSHWDKNRNDAVDPGELTAIDHVLLSPSLYRDLLEVTYVQAHDPLTATDHFPIVVTLAAE